MIQRGSGKTQTALIFDEYKRSNPLSYMLQSFKENPNVKKGFFIKRDGTTVPVEIPPLTALVPTLRLLFHKHGSGKLYLRRQLNVTGLKLAISNWHMYMWGGGRQRVSAIKEIDVTLDAVPRVLQLLDMIDG